MKSNFRAQAKQRNNITLYDVPTVTETGGDLNYVMMSEGSELTSHHGSEDFVLVPGEPGPVVACYKASDPARVSGNQISHEQGYHVTRQPM